MGARLDIVGAETAYDAGSQRARGVLHSRHLY